MARHRNTAQEEHPPARRSVRLQARQAPAVLAPVKVAARIKKAKPATKRKTSPKHDCSTCGRSLARSSFPTRLTDKCDHDVNTCKACTKQWIATQLNNVTYDQLSCPECPHILQNKDVKRSATKDVYARYEGLERRGIADKTPGWRWCLNPKCRAGKVHQPLKEISTNIAGMGKKKGQKKGLFGDGTICVCDECDAKACVPCDVPFHEGETCAEYKKRAGEKAKQDEKASLATIERDCKKCPKCSTNIKHAGGCDMMKCTQCKTEFCWLCGTTYDIIRSKGHAKDCTYSLPGRIDPHALPAEPPNLLPNPVPNPGQGLRVNWNLLGRMFE